jgi:guanylate kinase
MFKAKFEMGFQYKFDVVLVNEDLKASLAEAQRLYDSFKRK